MPHTAKLPPLLFLGLLAFVLVVMELGAPGGVEAIFHPPHAGNGWRSWTSHSRDDYDYNRYRRHRHHHRDYNNYGRDFRAERDNYYRAVDTQSLNAASTGLNHPDRYIREWYERALGYKRS